MSVVSPCSLLRHQLGEKSRVWVVVMTVSSVWGHFLSQACFLEQEQFNWKCMEVVSRGTFFTLACPQSIPFQFWKYYFNLWEIIHLQSTHLQKIALSPLAQRSKMCFWFIFPTHLLSHFSIWEDRKLFLPSSSLAKFLPILFILWLLKYYSC